MSLPSVSPLEFSIVIPVYNERGNIGPLIDKIAGTCKSMACEILVVDDGSRDGTATELRAAAERHPIVRIIALKKNFGQSAALAAGVDHASASIVIAMDGDGQNDPADIPRLL